MAGDDLQTEHRAKKPSTQRDPNLRPCLHVLSGEEQGKVFVLEDGPSIIGRGPTAKVRIEDAGISREHAKVIVGHDLVTLKDLESTNGTYLDGAPVDVAIVRDGNRIHVGPDVSLRFLYLDPAHEIAPSLEPSAKPRSAAAEIPLSPREREVAALVAEGLSNPQIGKRLFISPRTVTTHLVKIYARLELHSRSALTRYVLENGLLLDEDGS